MGSLPQIKLVKQKNVKYFPCIFIMLVGLLQPPNPPFQYWECKKALLLTTRKSLHGCALPQMKQKMVKQTNPNIF